MVAHADLAAQLDRLAEAKRQHDNAQLAFSKNEDVAKHDALRITFIEADIALLTAVSVVVACYGTLVQREQLGLGVPQ